MIRGSICRWARNFGFWILDFGGRSVYTALSKFVMHCTSRTVFYVLVCACVCSLGLLLGWGEVAQALSLEQGIALPELAERSLVAPEIQRIQERGKLIVAMVDQETAPFLIRRNGQLDGVDGKIAVAIAKSLNVELEVLQSAKTFDEVVEQVYALKADLAISKVSRTMQRAQLVQFSRPYVQMRQGLLVNRLQIAQQAQGRELTDVVRRLQGKVGVLEGSSYINFTQQKFPKAVAVEYPTWEAVVDAVVRGEVVAAYRDELEVKKVVLSKPEAALQFQTVALTDAQDGIAIALPWDSHHLLAFVNQYLDINGIDYSADKVLQEYADYFGLKLSSGLKR
jgi:polar amino acid transport system substrate-binding protein